MVRRIVERTPRTSLLAIAALAVALSGCALGDRPSFDQAALDTAVGAMTGDPAIDAVLTRLDFVEKASFTAEYNAIVTFSGSSTSLTVVQAGDPTKRSVTIGTVRFLTDGAVVTTCITTTEVCTDGANAAAVSDTGVTPDLAFGAAAKRLRRDAAVKTGATTASTLDVDGLTATCVDVPVSGGTKEYCAFDNGVIARFVGGDVTVDLTHYTSEFDESLFTPVPPS
jgi:hypothetical protein